MEKNRRPTWIEFYIKPPVVGTVFIHATKPEKPCIVHKIVDEEIYRTDTDGKVNGWALSGDATKSFWSPASKDESAKDMPIVGNFCEIVYQKKQEPIKHANDDSDLPF